MSVSTIQNPEWLIDTNMVETLSCYHWRRDKDGYLMAGGGGKPTIKMHRLVMAAARGVEVDHLNGIRTDNRKSNLRLCTHAQNLSNTRVIRAVSGQKGVYWSSEKNKWRAAITVNNRQKFLGYFELKETAAKAYDAAAKKYFGVFAATNEEIKNDHKTL